MGSRHKFSFHGLALASQRVVTQLTRLAAGSVRPADRRRISFDTLEPRRLWSGDGLSATCYDNIDLTGTEVQRLDATVDFAWASGSPDAGIGADSFSVRWTGHIQTVEAGTYTFYTNSDEGVRLWVNGVQLVDNWTPHTVTENSGTITLAADMKYDIKVEYYEGTGDATMQLSWQRPGQSKVIIPQANLFALNFDTSWFGNTFGESGRNDGTWVQQYMHDIWVKPDGRIYANSQWDEGGREAGIYQNGQVLGKMAGDTHNFLGGRTVAGNGTHVWLGQKGGYVRRYNPDGSTAGSRITVTTGAWGPTGLAASATELFISDGPGNLIKVFNASTMTQSRSFAFSNPGKLTVAPDGTLWIICTDDGSGSTVVRHYSNTGTLLSGTITGDTIMDVEFDNQGRLMVANAGQTQQVKFYDVSGTPTLVDTLGVLGGILGGTPGVVAPDKFNGITGVGTDANGNIYVSTSGLENNPWGTRGAELHSFSSGKTHLWSLQGLMFIDAADADPANPADVYTAHERYSMNFADNTPGGEWSYEGYTINPVLYPNDPRAQGRYYSVRAQRVDGHLFLYMNDMNGKELTVYRMDGEIAVAAAMWSHGSSFVPTTATPPGTNWFWRDADGDGQFDASEFQSANTSQSISGNVDSNGDVWVVKWFANAIHRYQMQGVDANGVPIYSTSALTTYTRPPLFPYDQLVQAQYQAETDTMFLAGFTSAYPRSGDQFMPLGRVVARYDNWSTDPVTEDQVFVLPFNASSAVAKSMAVEGDYLFVGYAKAEQVVVYEIDTGRLVGHLRPGPEINNEHGDLDIPYGIQVVKRSNGEYVVFHEDDRYAKQVMYRWTPPADDSSQTNYAWDFGTDTGQVDPAAAGFTMHKGRSAAAWTVETDHSVYTGGGGTSSGAATTSVVELATAGAFAISANLRMSFSAYDAAHLLAAGTSTASGTTSSHITFSGIGARLYNNNGSPLLQIVSYNGSSNDTAVASTAWTGSKSNSQHLNMVLEGVRSGNDLVLTFTVTDGLGGSGTITHNAGPGWTGTHVGYGVAIGTDRSVRFDDLSVTAATSLIPSAPSALAASAASSSQINLSWSDGSSDETGFKIERRTGTTGTWAQIDTVSANVSTYQDSGLTAQTLYEYRVRAYSASGDSAYSNTAAATTPSASTNTVSWDFGTAAGKDGVTDFNTSGAGTWSLQNDAWRHATQSSSSGTAGVASNAVTGLGGSNFSVNLSAQTLSFSNWDRFGLVALGSSAGDSGIAAILSYNNGSPTLSLKAGGIESGTTLSSSAWGGAAGGAFSMLLTGTYVGNDLELTFTVTDQNNHSQSLTWTVAAASYMGNYVGFGHDGGASRQVDFDLLEVSF